MKTAIIPVLLIILVCLDCSCDKKQTTTDPIPATPSAANPPVDPDLRWSEDIHLIPAPLIFEELRAWSHQEIAQRHQAMVMKELPKYITRLRGSGDVIETSRSAARWHFRVLPEHVKDFENYLVELGIPRNHLHESKMTLMEENDFPNLPKDRLTHSKTILSVAEGERGGINFGKSVQGVTYYLTNANIRRAAIRITVAWQTGDVEVMEHPRDPYDD